MKVTQILSAGFGVAVVCFAGVVFLGTRGASNSLRGGSPTKSLGARGAARRALLKTLVYGTRKTNSRRLQNTLVSCDKVATITQDTLACVYPSNPAGQTGTQSHCLAGALVTDGLFASSSPVVSLLERSSEILDADAVSFPYGDAVGLATVMSSICTAPGGPGSNGRGLSALTQVSLKLVTHLAITHAMMLLTLSSSHFQQLNRTLTSIKSHATSTRTSLRCVGNK